MRKSSHARSCAVRSARFEALESRLAFNGNPVANVDGAYTPMGTMVIIDALANDTDPDGDPLSIVEFTQPGAGVVELVSGKFRYTPRAGYTGLDGFNYAITDGRGGFAFGTVWLGVQPPTTNSAPIAQADSVTIAAATSVTVNVLANDSDPNGDPLSVSSFTQTAHGTVAQVSGGLRYTPASGYWGADSFNYTISDGRGGSATATVSITVQPVGDTTPPSITNRTPANGATVTTTSINIDVTFSEQVFALDVTDLVLTGSGAADAVKSAPIHLGGNTWRFGVSNLRNGPVNVSLAPDANDIEDAAGNDLAPANWSFSVNIQVPPVLAAIGDQTMPSSQDLFQINLVASDANNDPLTFSASAQSVEYHLDQTLGLSFSGGNESFNWGGRNEKWFTGTNSWHYITPDGKLYRWQGGNLANDVLVDQVSTAAYTNTSLLYNAQPNNAPAVLSVSGSTLTINPSSGFSGKFYVTVTVSDGRGGTDSKQFTVTVQSSGTIQVPPVLAAIGDQTIPASQDLLQINLVASDGNSDPLTFSASAQSVEYRLDQTLGLSFSGGNEYFNWGGRNEKWFNGASSWYYITPDGKLYRWLGGNLANDILVEQVSTAAYMNTSLLYNAQSNNAPAVLSVSGSTLTINPNSGFSGKFYVTVTVSDGRGGTDSKQFAVTVT